MENAFDFKRIYDILIVIYAINTWTSGNYSISTKQKNIVFRYSICFIQIRRRKSVKTGSITNQIENIIFLFL